jgi:hypothetical protein
MADNTANKKGLLVLLVPSLSAATARGVRPRKKSTVKPTNSIVVKNMSRIVSRFPACKSNQDMPK